MKVFRGKMRRGIKTTRSSSFFSAVFKSMCNKTDSTKKGNGTENGYTSDELELIESQKGGQGKCI